MSISAKARFGDSVRRFSFEKNTSYDALCSKLVSFFPTAETPLKLRYIDDEKDMVMLSSDAELSELCYVYDNANMSVVHVMVNEEPGNTGARGYPGSYRSNNPLSSSSSSSSSSSTSRDTRDNASQNTRLNNAGRNTGVGANASENASAGGNENQGASAGMGSNPMNQPPYQMPPFGTYPPNSMNEVFAGLSNFLSEVSTNINNRVEAATRAGLNTMSPGPINAPPPPPCPMFMPVPGLFQHPHPPPFAGGPFSRGRNRHRGQHRSQQGACQGARHGPRGHRARRSSPTPAANPCGPCMTNPLQGLAGIAAPIIELLCSMFSLCTTASADTRRDARNLCSAASGISPNVLRDIAAKLGPAVAMWLAVLPGDDQGHNEGVAPIPDNSIDWLVGVLGDEVRDSVSPSLADALSQFVRTALRDPSVVRVVRSTTPETLCQVASWLKERDTLQFLTEMFTQTRAEDPDGIDSVALRNFETHTGVSCDSCGCIPIVGIRYKAMNRANYDVCGKCVDEGKVNIEEEGLELKKCQYVWSLELGDDVKVPQAPLARGDFGAKVALLQKALTDVGFMKPSMYLNRVGFYGRRTEYAVRELQTTFLLKDITQLGVYDAVTAASLLSVLDSDAPAVAHTGSPSESQTGSHSGAGPSNSVPETQA